jgi:hypothetical protein
MKKKITLSLKLSTLCAILDWEDYHAFWHCFWAQCTFLQSRFSENEGIETLRSHNDLNTAEYNARLAKAFSVSTELHSACE